MTGRWRQHLIRSNTERSALNRCRMNAMGLVARSKERMKGRSQGGWQLQHSLLNPCIEGKAPSSSPAGPVQRPSQLSCPWGDTAGTAQPWGESPPSRGCSSPPQSPSMTQLAQPPRAHSYRRAGSCQIPAHPPGRTRNPAEITGAPLALENRRPTHTGLSAQRWSSATNQPWKPENPALIKRLKSQKRKESHCFNGRRHRTITWASWRSQWSTGPKRQSQTVLI